MKHTLTVHYAGGAIERVDVRCGSDWGARRIPVRVGRALESGSASATLDYDGLARTAVNVHGTYYMRIAGGGIECKNGSRYVAQNMSPKGLARRGPCGSYVYCD